MTKFVQVPISDLKDEILDWAVSKVSNPEGRDGFGWFERDSEGFLFDPLNECRYSPSTDWREGGPIIENSAIDLDSMPARAAKFRFHAIMTSSVKDGMGFYPRVSHYGPTALVAAMRCFVQSHCVENTIGVPEAMLAYERPKAASVTGGPTSFGGF